MIRTKTTFCFCAILTLFGFTSFSSVVMAGDTAELAKAAQNPVANMISLPLQFLFPK